MNSPATSLQDSIAPEGDTEPTNLVSISTSQRRLWFPVAARKWKTYRYLRPGAITPLPFDLLGGRHETGL